MKDLPKILKWLGFNYSYKLEVLGDPEFVGNNTTYSMKLISKDLIWLNFRIKHYEESTNTSI